MRQGRRHWVGDWWFSSVDGWGTCEGLNLT